MSKLDKLIESAIKAASVPMRETKSQQIIRRLKEDTAYQEFFKKALDKHGVSSPADFDSDEKKKEFFNYVDKNYSAKKEGKLSEAYFPIHSADSQDTKIAKTALANWFKNSIEMGMQNKPLGRSTFNILNDLIDDYALAYAQDEIEAAEKVMLRRR